MEVTRNPLDFDVGTEPDWPSQPTPNELADRAAHDEALRSRFGGRMPEGRYWNTQVPRLPSKTVRDSYQAPSLRMNEKRSSNRD